ncbi:MAG: HD domain-containing protein [bacterium]|nr:HD domain-containing protein [bacterium]
MKSQFHDLKFQKKKLFGLLEKGFSKEDRKKIIAAFQFAQLKHKGQRRDEGSSYIIHPIRVGIILLEDIGTWDGDVVSAALLHDVVEDCRVRLYSIEKRFGNRVSHFVRALTRMRKKGETDAEKEIRKKEKILMLADEPIEVRLIKCADILDNLRCAADVPFWSWTPIAQRKFPRWRREFHVAEAFAKHVHPVVHREIESALRIFEIKRIVRGVMRLGM